MSNTHPSKSKRALHQPHRRHHQTQHTSYTIHCYPRPRRAKDESRSSKGKINACVTRMSDPCIWAMSDEQVLGSNRYLEGEERAKALIYSISTERDTQLEIIMAITHFLNGDEETLLTSEDSVLRALPGPPLTQSQASHKPWKAQTLWWWQLLLDKTFYLLMLMNPEENLKNSKHRKFKPTFRLLKPALVSLVRSFICAGRGF
jgi:hypothetical protein